MQEGPVGTLHPKASLKPKTGEVLVGSSPTQQHSGLEVPEEVMSLSPIAGPSWIQIQEPGEVPEEVLGERGEERGEGAVLRGRSLDRWISGSQDHWIIKTNIMAVC